MTNSAMEQKPVMTVTPAVNIVETPHSFIVSLDIPGAMKDRIKANIENNSLVIAADIVNTTDAGNAVPEKQYRREFSLANDIDTNSVEAQFELGVLSVTLKKLEKYVPKQIHIH